jgi:hypothetical protein
VVGETWPAWVWQDGAVSRGLRLASAGMAPALIARPSPAARLELAEVIVQDELTHDVILAGPAPAFPVFDTTGHRVLR